MPDGVIHYPEEGKLVPILSRHLPLGILHPDSFRYEPQIVEMRPDSAVYLWSDGVVETTSPEGEMFGEERLLDLFSAARSGADMFALITQRLREFGHLSDQSDDYSLVQIRPDQAVEALSPREQPVTEARASRQIGDWSMEYELRVDSLRVSDPVPLLMHMLLQSPGLRKHGGVINTILSELYSNSLEHGILELDSAMKNDAEGFRRYYQLRAERLQTLTEASIRIRAEVMPIRGGGLLRLRVKDSGAGFDFASSAPEGQNPAYYGRGLTLLASLCRRVEYFPPGNEVLVEFAWREQGNEQRVLS